MPGGHDVEMIVGGAFTHQDLAVGELAYGDKAGEHGVFVLGKIRCELACTERSKPDFFGHHHVAFRRERPFTGEAEAGLDLHQVPPPGATSRSYTRIL